MRCGSSMIAPRMKKPAEAGREGWMDYVDDLIVKLLILVALAFVYGLWRGINGQPLSREQSEQEDRS